MNTTVYLIRHGEVYNPKRIIYGRTVDVPLSSVGFEQAKSLGERLKDRGIRPDIIYCCTLTRAIQTAETMSKVYKGIDIKKDPDLQDVDGLGLELKTLDWYAKIGGDIYNYKGLEMEDLKIESPEQMVKRLFESIAFMRTQNEGKTIFIVSHGDPLAFTVWRLLNPGTNLPTIKELNKTVYLKKGEAWKIVFNKKGQVLDSELITRENTVKGEREF